MTLTPPLLPVPSSRHRIFSQPARSSDQVPRIGAIHQRFLQGSIVFIAHQLLDKLGEKLGFYYDHTTFMIRQWRMLSNDFYLVKLGAYLCPPTSLWSAAGSDVGSEIINDSVSSN